MSGGDGFYDSATYDDDIWDKVTRVGTVGGLTAGGAYAAKPLIKRLAKTKQGKLALAAAGILGGTAAGNYSAGGDAVQRTADTIRRNLPDEHTTNQIAGGAAMVGGAALWGRGARKAMKNFKDAGKKAVEYYRDGKGVNKMPKVPTSVTAAKKQAIANGLAHGAGGSALITTGNEYRKKR